MKTTISAVLALASSTVAQIASYSAPGETSLQYSVNVPAVSASSGAGDIFFQISAPTSYQWVGLGQGTEMAGANIFVLYASASGTNVTLSPRLGKGEFEPLFNSDAKVTVLDGSGIVNGKMIANVRCSSCAMWDGGSMQYTSTSAPWIWSAKSGPPLDSDSTSQDIQQHDNHGTFNFDLTKAAGGSSDNPFLTPSTSGSPASPSSTTASSSGSESSEGGMSESSKKHIAHGVLMGLAFVVFFPIGAMLLHLFSLPGLVWIHAGTQIFAWILSIAGMGLGISLAKEKDQLSDTHPVIGLVVVSVLAFQPIGGFIHHRIWKQKHQKTIITTGHIWTGRALIILGMINGGLGLQLAANTKNGEIAYGVVAGFMGVAYITVVVLSAIKNRGRPTGETGEKLAPGSGSPSSSERGIDSHNT